MSSELEKVLDLIQRAFLKINALYVVGGSIASSKNEPRLNEEMARRRFEEIGSKDESFRIPVSSPEDNILHKLDGYRKGGYVSERQWNDVLGVLKVQENLEYEYLRKWAGVLGLSDYLEKAISQAKSRRQE